MKKSFLIITLFVFTSMSLILFNACSKKGDNPNSPPTLELKTGSGYTSDSISTIGESTSVRVGIVAMPSGDDYLNTFTVSHAFDTDPIVQDSSRVLSYNDRDGFEEDIDFMTRPHPGTETYYFTITNRNGLVVTKSVTLNVQ